MTEQIVNTIEIRQSHPDDERALTRLGQLDSACVPPAPLLLAFEDGELRAAVSLITGAAIANPFARTSQLVELLRSRRALTQRLLPKRLSAPKLLKPARRPA